MCLDARLIVEIDGGQHNDSLPRRGARPFPSSAGIFRPAVLEQ
ncbi:hypothetical protein [Novilysobacter concretionis]